MVLITTVPEVKNEFTPQAQNLLDFFSRGKVGFYIPLYQRPYSWTVENVDQLMEDITSGIYALTQDANALTFLGAIILCQEQKPRANIQPLEIEALPTTVYNVIDGQQRVSTLALLGTRVYQRAWHLIRRVEGDPYYADIAVYIKSQCQELARFFSFEAVGDATPKIKPIIIRGNMDQWTQNGADDRYASPVSSYLAAFIRNLDQGGADIPDRRTRLGKILQSMDTWIDQIVLAHLPDAPDRTPNAKTILEAVHQDLVWKYERDNYYTAILRWDLDDAQCSRLAECVQLCTLFHYLFKRVCCSIILPASENWAFDIFQSLNATGTPLTAVETFKPLVVNSCGNVGGYKGSRSEEYFGAIDRLFDTSENAAKKARLTNEFLNTFRLVSEGRSQHNQFSEQRKWLNDTYINCETAEKKQEFVRQMSDLARYWLNVIRFDPTALQSYHKVPREEVPDARLAVLCVEYLIKSNHRMAHTLLSIFYAKALRGGNGDATEFVAVAKSLAAFFTLWRSAYGNAGLDEVYRKVLNGDEEAGVPAFCYRGRREEKTSEALQMYLTAVLVEKGIGDRDEWIARAKNGLRYDAARSVCRFALFVTSDDTIPDPDEPGLVKAGRIGVAEYLTIDKWNSSDLKTVEHVAPKTRSEGWDEAIYKEDELFESIGNLTLLPVDVNASASNRTWFGKLLYYRYLALIDDAAAVDLEHEAVDRGIELSAETVQILREAKHADHIKHITMLKGDNPWDSELIERRTKRICSLLWDRMMKWLPLG